MRSAGGVRVHTPTWHDVFDYVVLCVGRATAFDPYGLQGHEKFSSNPYPLENKLRNVDPDEHVGIIGCGLTAIDLVCALKADQHRGRITLMSRRGLLPGVRRPAPKYDLRHFTVKSIEDLVAARGGISLKDLIQLTCRELDDAGASKGALLDEIFPSRWGLEQLRHQMACIDDGEIAQPLFIKLLAAAYQDAWYFLDPFEKAVAAGYGHIFYSVCCPMPRHRAAAILELADSGQLQIMRGLQSVAKDPRGRFVAITSSAPPLYFDRAFSAVSEVNAIHPMAAPILDGLVRSRQALAHPFGGIHVERTSSRVLDADNRPQPRLYAIGTTTSGAFYLVNGHFLSTRRSAQVASSIFTHHQENHAPSIFRCAGTAVPGRREWTFDLV